MHQLKNFLSSLFQLKPSLITSSAFDKLRVVVENYRGNRSEHYYDIQPSEEIVEYMKETGCKVPVMVYSDMDFS